MTQTALVTGSSRGIGFHTARLLLQQGMRVYINGRDRDRTRAAARELDPGGVQALALHFDVTDATAMESACAALNAGVDVLVNSAGIFPDAKTPALELSEDLFRQTLETNTLGPFRLCQLLLPAMIKRGHGRVVNLTSGFGLASRAGKNLAAYRSSKAALNLLTVTFAAEMDPDSDIRINAVDPGWVKTDMGGDSAPRTVEQAASDVAWAVNLPADGPHGCLLRYQQVVDWGPK